MKHLIDQHCLEATILSLELDYARLVGFNSRRERSQQDGLLNPRAETAAFVGDLIALSVFKSEGPVFGVGGAIREDDEEYSGREGRVREAAHAFVERLASQVVIYSGQRSHILNSGYRLGASMDSANC